MISLLSALPTQAAERVYLSFASANVSVSVEALEIYAKEGKIQDSELQNYLLLLSADDQEQFRNLLLDSYKFDPLMVSQFLNSPTGQIFLEKLGDLIQAKLNEKGTITLRNGSDAIRTALIKAAQDPEGLTPLNILRYFPSEGIQVNTQLLFELRDQITTLSRETEAVIDKIVKISNDEIASEPLADYTQKPDIRHSGPYSTLKRTILLNDRQRNRKILVDVYVPAPLEQVNQGKPNSIPIIVVSHGLAANRTDYAAFGEHLASYGFVAALIQHPGSDTDQIQALLSGRATDVFKVSEFVDRPADISFLLDSLERRNQDEFDGQLNVNQVGVAGYSFGAYTALAIAGAEIDFDNLQADCSSEFDSPNLARLFQCRALELPRKSYQFRDERVKAIMPINPVNSSIFGEQSLSQISIPILWKTSGEDKVTPVAWEQVRSFTWLTTPDKYLLLAEGDHHINLNLSMVNQAVSASLKEIVDPVPLTINNYTNAVGLAFFKVYVANDPSYSPYLQAAYAKAISENPYPLSLVRSVTPEQFFQAIRQAKQQG
ncbi:alpha/beta hydrolase [Capilliphycus salinus ALCB114379]|uniref:alpha/beta hydrolase n=1 Tax=Capilliphycus salinus TaxID=2768948 RepID=UPI0039A510D1